MATEDKLSKKELGGDVGAGVAGALLGALMSPLFTRQAGVSLTQQVGKSLYDNRDKITGPIFSRLSKEDERMFEGLVVKLNEKDLEHLGIPYIDILNMLLKRMGPWASDRYRSIAIGIPNPPAKSKKVRLVEKRTGDITDTEESTAPVNPQVQFLVETIEDVIRFGGDQVNVEPVSFEQGITVVLQNLRVRNIVDADSAAAKISRWWHEPMNKEDVDAIVAKGKELLEVIMAEPPLQTIRTINPVKWLVGLCAVGSTDKVVFGLPPKAAASTPIRRSRR